MSKPNIPLESTPKVITRSQAKQDSQLAKIVDLNQKGNLKIKPIRNREYSTDNKCQNISDPIPTEQELDNSLYPLTPKRTFFPANFPAIKKIM